MKFRITFYGVLVVIASVTGCTTYEYIVLRGVPESPSIAVIPANDYLSEIAFANATGQAILRAGVKVVARPATKEVTTERTISGAHGNQAAGEALIQSGEAKLREKYIAWEDFEADYIVQTYVTSRQLKILKRETKEILAVILAHDYSTGPTTIVTWQDKLREALQKLEISAN